MTPHSERDEYSTMSATTAPQPAKPVKVRPVVPLKFGQGRKNKPSVSTVAHDANIAPPEVAKDQVTNSHVETTPLKGASNGHTVIENSETGTENPKPTVDTTNELLDDASLKGELSTATTQSDQPSEPLSSAPTSAQEPTAGPQLPKESKDEAVHSATRENTSAEPDPDRDQKQSNIPDTNAETATVTQSAPAEQMQPPPGVRSLPPVSTDSPKEPQTSNGHNDLKFGGFNDFSGPSLARGSFNNGLISPPHEALIHAPAFVPGHSHHASVSNTPITMGLPSAMFPPPGFDPRPAGFMPNGSDYPPFDGRMHGSVSLDTPITNGHSGPGSRTMSHSSTGPVDLNSSMTTDDAFRRSSHRPLSNGRPLNGSVHIPLMMVPTAQRPDPATESAMMLRDFVFSQFGSADSADYLLEVYLNDKIALSIPIHGMILSRSPTVQRLIATSRKTASEASGRVIRLLIDDKIFVEQAFIEVLQYVYGAPLAPGFPALVNQVPPFSTRDTQGESAQFARQVLSHALSLVSTSCALQLESAVMEAMQAVPRLIRWDTIQLALAFVLQSGLPTSWQNDGLEKDRHLSGNSALKDSIAGELLRDIVDYLAINFPHHFNFDASVSQLEGSPRLPMILDAKPSMSNHRLSRMQFGQLPAEQSDYVTATLSSILVSLPYEVLATLFNHPALITRGKNFQHASIVNTVVADRETRRQNVLNSKRVAPRGDGPLTEATQWRELVVDDQYSITGYGITRQRVEK